jgi:L-threonylcarbamoyladenylate synthase
MKEIICLEDDVEGTLALTEGGVLEEVVEHLKRGALVVYPTETLYGLGGDPFDVEVIDRIYAVKRRPKDMGLAVAVAAVDDFDLVAEVPEYVWDLVAEVEAISVAFLLPKRGEVPRSLTGGRDNIVVRAVHHPLAVALAEAAGPVISTSANIHGREPPRTMEAARDQLGDSVDYYIDYGEAPVMSPSTIIEPTPDGGLRIIREGVVTSDWLDDMLADTNND